MDLILNNWQPLCWGFIAGGFTGSYLMSIGISRRIKELRRDIDAMIVEQEELCRVKEVQKKS